ncbi:alpha/beta hydrolase [Tanticharoenia sakaeratensis]|uniref:Hydrolase n=1 Tax=Tanticharoenia sakaeratensis NBRC 103193 TaxID=1231623 RepID=A0A0D6MPI6_9PROT|nr:alpha/beta hydrolase [Tanticharoenia sakaeratensis]GAN55609.1 hydrolase [Tanticharoenia sakaeratensis NBRC 103193]GBQ22849.1 hydrolase [Tanticharoenia sakaeratensis NBRC 103193]
MKHLFVGLLALSQIAAAPFVSAPIRAGQGDPGVLGGTILAPAGRSGDPVVLMIPGSGPTDRDGNSAIPGVRPATLRLLAEGLASRGIASVRVDKRGMFTSAHAAVDGNHVVFGDYVDDTRAWIAAIRARTGARCVWLLGHSEGSLVAMDTAHESRDICGLLLISPPGRSFHDVLIDQLGATPENAPRLVTALDRLRDGHPVDVSSLSPGLRAIMPPAVQPYLISMLALDPTAMLAGTHLPVLIVHGQTDFQTRHRDALALEAADPQATLVMLPGVNHIMRDAPAADSADGRAANIATYGTAGALDPRVIPTIANFVTAHP